MAIVRRRAHRWWVAFVSVAVAMLANADASAHEMKVEGCCGIVRGVFADRPAEAVVLETACVALPLRPAALRNDDGTTRDKSDHDLWDDFEDDDGSDLLAAAWLREAGRCSITPGSEFSPARIQTGSRTSLKQLHLRC
jgi:hypothetical protein